MTDTTPATPATPAEHDELQCWTFQTLERAERVLYYEARRYCLISERGFIQDASGICAEHDPEFVSIGNSARDLTDAANAYTEALAQWRAAHPESEVHD